MPNRILRDWTYSDLIDKVSFQAEVLFTRLIMKADDYGSYYAKPKLINGSCFPLKDIRESDISRWLQELASAGLIVFYRAENKDFLHIVNFNQRLRSMKKCFPQIPENVLNKHLRASCQQVDRELTASCQPEEEVETEEETEIEGEKKDPAPDFNQDSLFPEEKKDYPVNLEEEKERKKVAQKKESEIVDYFHEKCKNLPRVQVLSDKRKTSIKMRLKDHGEEKVMKVIEMAAESKFLCGDNHKNWTADFDWIFNPTNFIKIMEGNYKNREYNLNANNNGSSQARRR